MGSGCGRQVTSKITPTTPKTTTIDHSMSPTLCFRVLFDRPVGSGVLTSTSWATARPDAISQQTGHIERTAATLLR